MWADGLVLQYWSAGLDVKLLISRDKKKGFTGTVMHNEVGVEVYVQYWV